MNTVHKDEIKNRMIKRAASLWGVAPNEIESSFDPLITLLINVCASEISKISGEIANSENRITERLLQLMTPDTLSGARTAHAIAYAEPNSKIAIIAPEHLFYYNKKTRGHNASTLNKSIFFSPIKEFKLINAQVKHLFCGNQLIGFNKKNKQVRKIDQQKPAKPSTLYIGIQSNEDNLNLKDTQLYFELFDVQNTELFYYYLRHAEFYFNDKPIAVTNTYYKRPNEQKSFVDSLFSSKSNKLVTAEHDILKNYKRHFFNIESDVLLSGNARFPKALEERVDTSELELLQTYHWIEIKFSSVIDNKMLQNVFCTLNAFPVMNRKLENISYQLKKYINIVPLATTELFLGVKTITNTSGEIYKSETSGDNTDKKGTYTLRKDNIGKLDSRKAKEFLLHLIELLKQESAAFSIFGNEFIDSTVHEMNQKISLLEIKVNETKQETKETNYLSINPFKSKDTLLVDYWITNGEEANNIKTGTALQIYKGSEFKQQESMLLTTSFNGKDELSRDERLFAYRRALLSRNRVVTKQDVIALCYDLCGSKLKDIEINKVFRTNFKLGKGLTPTIEIVLYPSDEALGQDIEWESIKANILTVIEEQSINVFPYAIVIKK